MKRLSSLLILLFSLFSPPPAHADGFSLKAEYPPFATEEQKSRFEENLKRAEALLPDSVKKSIGREITIRFTPEKENSPPSCSAHSRLHYGFFGSKASAKVIELDRSLLAPNRLENFFAFGGECSPGGALLQNLGRIYDAKIDLSQEEARILNGCENREGGSNQDPSCNKLRFLKGQISSRPQFQKLRNWNSDSGSKGELVERSPDLSEFEDAQTSFAVNFQLYLSDKNYACRRPATARYLSSELKHQAFPEGGCKTNYTLYTQNMPDPVTIDPSRVYRIDYLWAGPGTAMMSRWGHAMVRIVQCAPARTELSEKCLEDKDHHLVVSYRAYVDDFAIDNWKGLVGDYPSQMLVMRLKDVVEEYTLSEQRDLYSVPLKLDEKQKGLLLSNIVEQYWNYRGRYKFLSTNCATETKDLLQAADKGGLLSALNLDDTLTPSGLYDQLQDLGFAEDIRKLSRKELVKRGLLFEADSAFLKKPYARLHKQLPEIPEQVDDFFRQTKSGERLKFFHALPESKQESQAPVFYLLEANAKQVKQSELDKKLFKLLMNYSEDKNHPLNGKIIEYKAKLRDLNAKMQPWEITKAAVGYGVPFPEELTAENPVRQPIDDRLALVLELQKIIPELFPEDWSELQSIRKNMDYFKTVAYSKDINRKLKEATAPVGEKSGDPNAAPRVVESKVPQKGGAKTRSQEEPESAGENAGSAF